MSSGRPRRAHLFEEEATWQIATRGHTTVAVTDSGPVGALLLLLEIDHRGIPWSLRACPAGEKRGFPGGALEATWDSGRRKRDLELPLSDLVGLARYALA